MATKLLLVAGNTAPPQEITCDRKDGSIIDLTGCTVTLIIAKGNTITQAGRTAVVTDATNGIIEYTPLTTDFPTKGTYKGDVEVEYGDGGIEVLYEQLKVKARNRIS